MTTQQNSDYLNWMRRLNVRVPTLLQHRACLYLEKHGYRFLIDFGLQNAMGKARVHQLQCQARRRRQ